MKKQILGLSLLALLVGCNSGPSKYEIAAQEAKDNRTAFKAALEAKLGITLTQMKISGTSTEAYIVYKDAATGEFIAANISKFDSKIMTSLDQASFDSDDIVRNMQQKQEWVTSGYSRNITRQESYTDYEAKTNSYYDSGCSCNRSETVYLPVTKWKDVIVGSEWVDTSGNQYFYYGGGFRFENAAGASRDLDMYAAAREEMSEATMAAKFKSEFSLSTDRAKELANVSSKYLKLSSSRELTTKEKDQFAMKSLGVSMNQIESAMRKKAVGLTDDYEELLKQAAQVNKTTPEMIGKFFDQVVE